MDTIEEILRASTIEGHAIRLPDVQLDRKVYLDVKKVLEQIGGKWKGGKIAAFVFRDDPSPLISDILSGKQRNIRKEFQFFETPTALADRLAELALISGPELSVLEPSAGCGAIIHALHRKMPGLRIDCYELQAGCRATLEKIPFVQVLGADFLNNRSLALYDRIVANPPFAKNKDIAHIAAMYTLLKKGGRLVTVCSRHYELSGGRKERQFRNWIKTLDATVIPLDDTAFKASRTSVRTNVLVIDK